MTGSMHLIKQVLIVDISVYTSIVVLPYLILADIFVSQSTFKAVEIQYIVIKIDMTQVLYFHIRISTIFFF